MRFIGYLKSVKLPLLLLKRALFFSLIQHGLVCPTEKLFYLESFIFFDIKNNYIKIIFLILFNYYEININNKKNYWIS